VQRFPARAGEPASARSRDEAPRGLSPGRELAEACRAAGGVAAVLIQIAVAQLTLGLTAAFVIVGRLTRWRPAWLAWPAAAGVCLVLARGPGAAVAGYLAGARHLIRFVAGPGPALARLAHPSAVFGGWLRWLPAQLPVALILAAAEAGAIARLRGQAAPYRPGTVAAVRRAYLTASLRRGEVATADGGCVGIVAATGRRAEVSWQEAEGGVLVTGSSAATVTGTGLDLAIAAIQHRKAVFIIDLAGSGDQAHASVAAACAASQAPLVRLGDRGVGYDPLSAVPPARAAALVMAMLDWAETTAAARSLCRSFLSCGLELIAADGASAWHRGGVIADLADLARPGRLRQRMGHANLVIRNRDALVSRAAECASRLDADSRAAAALGAAADQLAGLASAAVVGWLVPPRPASGEPVSLARAVAERQVILACPDPRGNGRPGAMVARLVVADLLAILSERGDIGAPADCLVLVDGCEAIGRGLLSELLALEPATGTSVVLGTTDRAASADLAGRVGVMVERGRARPDEVAMLVRGPRPRQVRALAIQRASRWPGGEREAM
jgi:hypothetical protein